MRRITLLWETVSLDMEFGKGSIQYLDSCFVSIVIRIHRLNTNLSFL